MKTQLLLLFTLFSGLFYSQDCSSLKTGTWKVIDDTGNGFDTYIDRTETHQIEYTPAYGLKIKSEIVWESECKYTVKNGEILENQNNITLPPGTLETPLQFEVVEINEKNYLTKCYAMGELIMEVKYIKED